MAFRRYTPDELEPTDEELALARTLGEGGANEQAIGSAVGSLAGTALGALGLLGGPAVGAATMGLGNQLGSQAGQLIGNKVAEGKLKSAEDGLLNKQREREKRVNAYQLRLDALNALLAKG